MESALSYPDWKAPAEDGQVLIWPDAQEIVSQTRENQRRLASASRITIAGIPLNELRQAHRRQIGHADDAAPIVATGHQTELIHPGVWVKHVLINAAAKAVSGVAVQFAVDTDSPKHLAVRWPGESLPITDDPAMNKAAWCGLLRGPSAEHLARIADHFLDASEQWDFQPVLPAVINAMRPAEPTPRPLAPLLVKAILEPSMFGEAPYLAFVHHLVSDAAEFAKAYNASLAMFRRIHKTKSPMRPMPDLYIDETSVEVPFWLDDLSTGERKRPSVFPTDNGFVLELVSGEEFVFDRGADGYESAAKLRKWLGERNHRLSPRALTLTTYLRLLVVDQFVHGIGGGRYDQVSDDLIRSYFQFEPPAFAVTTATMVFPGAVGRQRACVPCVLQEGHRLKHSVLGAEKRRMVESIEDLPRRSLERQAAFLTMHRERTSRLSKDPAVARWEARLRKTLAQHAEDQVLFDRELFYAIQSRQRLLEMIERYDGAFSP